MKIKKKLVLFLVVLLSLLGGCDNHKCTPLEPEEHIVIAATCEKEGKKEIIIKCSECEDIISTTEEIIPKTKHVSGSPVKENETDLKYDEVTYCINCNVEISRKEIKKCEHVYEYKKENIINPTCEKEGSYDNVSVCLKCHEVGSRETIKIERLEHTPGTPIRENENSNSYEEVIYCLGCNKELSRKVVLVNCEHSYEEEIRNNVYSTCESSGSYDVYLKCVKCNSESLKEHVTIEALGHEEGTPVKENETSESYEEVVYCTRCEKEISRTIVKLSCEHEVLYKEEVTLEPTCTLKGELSRIPYCYKCNEIFTSQIEKYPLPENGHTFVGYVEENVINPTCEEKGSYDMVSYCDVCDALISKTSYTKPALGHKYQEPVIENVVEKTYTQDGSYDEVVYCGNCNEVLIRETYFDPVTDEYYYSQYDYLELSNNENTIDNLVDNGNGTYLLNAKTNSGKEVRLLIDGEISVKENGWASFPKETQIYLLDSLFGINYVDYHFNTEGNHIYLNCLYNLLGKDTVETKEELVLSYGINLFSNNDGRECGENPNYFSIQHYCDTNLEVESIKIYYNNVESKLSDISLFVDEYQLYVPGETYIDSIESDPSRFYLIAKYTNASHRKGDEQYTNGIYSVPANYYEVGSIIDKSGTKHSRIGRVLEKGDKLEVKIADFTDYIDLCVDTYDGDTLYETMTTQNINSIGTQNVLVIPFMFKDQESRINEKSLLTIKKALGNVVEDGLVNKYLTNDTKSPSLSDFINQSSYGKLTINSHITNTYIFDGNAEDYYYMSFENYYVEQIQEWLYKQNIDLSKFDQNNDGYIDSIIIINTLDESNGTGGYNRIGLSGAYKRAYSYDDENAGITSKPTINTFINLPMGFLFDDKLVDDFETGIVTNTLIHEFGHYLGLTDYYDVEQGGINVIGNYDMQSDNNGDWNSYSKFLLGWIEPTIIDGTKDSYEITIDSYATSGDAIVIPQLGYEYNNTAFDEYIIIDFFTADGLYKEDAQFYGFDSVKGVRIYHVNSVYEQRTYETQNKDTGIIATMHFGTSSNGKYVDDGKYLIELIQKGKVNTFTKSKTRTTITSDDLFFEGDTFKVEEYQEFFHNGKMDNGESFGYEIIIDSIVSENDLDSAVIKINKVN